MPFMIKIADIFTHLLLGCLISVSLFFMSCETNMDYNTHVREGLESGVQKDSLFLGYHFGMGKQEFRDYSWELNQEGVITGFVDINYEVDFLKSKATMVFYPEFEDEKIVRIPVSVGYDAWAPWNEEFWPEELAKDLQDYFSNEYEIKFYQVYVPEIERQAYVSVDGNREIRIYKNAESTVMVDFIDLNSVETVSSKE